MAMLKNRWYLSQDRCIESWTDLSLYCDFSRVSVNLWVSTVESAEPIPLVEFATGIVYPCA